MDEVEELKKALDEALTEWEDSAQYKGEYLTKKHRDIEQIEEVRERFGIPRGYAHRQLNNA